LAYLANLPVTSLKIDRRFVRALAAMLREAGCDQGQGFHLGYPVPAADFAALWLSADHRAAVALST